MYQFFVLMMLCLVWPLAGNAEPTAAPQKIVILTGPRTGTYYHMAQNIFYVAKQAGIPVEVVETRGAVENIEQLLAAGDNGFLMAFLQEDALASLKQSDDAKHVALAKNLRVLPMYREEIHIVANKNIADVKALEGKKIAVGQEGSGTWITAATIFNLLGIRPAELLRASPEAALADVLEGKADAMIAVSGKPMHILLNLMKLEKTQEDGKKLMDSVHLLPISEDNLLQHYLPATFTPDDYPFLQEPVTSVAVRAALVMADVPADSDACTLRKKLAAALAKDAEVLAKNGHPKWQDIAAEPLSGWKADNCFTLPDFNEKKPEASEVPSE